MAVSSQAALPQAVAGRSLSARLCALEVGGKTQEPCGELRGPHSPSWEEGAHSSAGGHHGSPAAHKRFEALSEAVLVLPHHILADSCSGYGDTDN